MQLFWGEKRCVCSLVIFLYLRPNRDSLVQSQILLSTVKMEPKLVYWNNLFICFLTAHCWLQISIEFCFHIYIVPLFPTQRIPFCPKKNSSLIAKSNTQISLMQFWERPEPVIYCIFMQLLAPDCTEPCKAHLRIEAEEKIIMWSKGNS